MSADPWGPLLLQLVLILINGWFAATEVAILSLNEIKLRADAEEGDKVAAKLLKLTEAPNKFLSTIQVCITLAGFLGSAFAAEAFSDPLTQAILNAGAKMDPEVLDTLCVVGITLVLSYFTLVLGELTPKRIAMHYPEKMARMGLGVINFCSGLFRPVVWLLSASTNGLLRLLGIDPHADEEEVTEEDIRMMVDMGEEVGAIEETEKEMIENIFEFNNLTAENVMTHRTDIVAVEVTDSLETVANLAMEEGFSRIPVYEDDLDNIVGLIYVKDLLPFTGKAFPANMTAADKMRSVYYVPESKKCGDLFEELTEKRLQLAIVVDEYGGTAGLITMEDLIESILGNIQDEYDDEEEDIEQLSETVFTIDGVTDLDEVEDELGRILPKGDYDTLAGMIISHLGYIPSEDETPSVEVNHILFTVLTVEDRRIEKVRVEKLPLPEKDEEEEDDD